MKKRIFKSRQEWRNWLEENHMTEKEIWVVYYKKHTKKPSLNYEEAVEEALCYGWIDSTAKRFDDEKYMQKFTPRKINSNWSASNKKRVTKLIKSGSMTQAGLEKIDIAKQNGSWDRLTEIDRERATLKIPEDLHKALESNPAAMKYFNEFAASYKKQYLWWLMSAKKIETREKRINPYIS